MADSPNRILGRCTITVNGTKLDSKPGAELSPGTGERQAEMGEYGPVGFTEKAVAATLKVDVYVKPGVTQAALYSTMDATILFEGDNGYSCTLVGCTATKVSGVKTGGGGAVHTCEFFALTSRETSS
jgi:tail tube protein